MALAWISNSLPRPPAKRAAALAFINAISNTSSIYASYMYKTEFGKLSFIHSFFLSIFLSFVFCIHSLSLFLPYYDKQNSTSTYPEPNSTHFNLLRSNSLTLPPSPRTNTINISSHSRSTLHHRHVRQRRNGRHGPDRRHHPPLHPHPPEPQARARYLCRGRDQLWDYGGGEEGLQI